MMGQLKSRIDGNAVVPPIVEMADALAGTGIVDAPCDDEDIDSAPAREGCRVLG